MRRYPRFATATAVLCATAALLLLPGTVEGQIRGRGASGRTRVAGEVLDNDGKPLVGVKVIFTNQDTSSKNTRTKTKKTGKFAHPLVEFGNYEITFELEGYKVIAYNLDNRDSQDQDIGSFTARFNLAQDPKSIELKASGVAVIKIVMAPEADYERLALEAAEGAPVAAGEASKVTSRRHPAEEGKELFALKNYAGALAKFKEALEEKGFQDDPNIYFAVGRAHFQLEQFDEAAVSLDRVLELAPEPPSGLHYLKAQIANQQGRTREAVDSLEKEANPTPGMLATLGSLYRDLGEEDKAISTLEQAIAAEPGNLNALLSLGSLHSDAGNRQQAEVYFEKAAAAGAAAGQGGAAVFFNLGALNFNKGNFKNAAAAYERAVVLKPSYANAHKELGYTYRELGREADALTHFQRYLDLQPNATDKDVIAVLVKVMSRN